MTTDERLETLEKELARAKRRNRRLLAAVGLAVGVLGLAWIGAGTANRAEAQGGGVPAVIRAGKFEIIDANGKIRGIFDAATDGARLCLYDKKGVGEGRIRLMLGVDKLGPALSLFDEEDKPRAVLGTSGGPGLNLYSENGGALLAIIKFGPAISMYDRNRRVIWQAP